MQGFNPVESLDQRSAVFSLVKSLKVANFEKSLQLFKTLLLLFPSQKIDHPRRSSDRIAAAANVVGYEQLEGRTKDLPLDTGSGWGPSSSESDKRPKDAKTRRRKLV